MLLFEITAFLRDSYRRLPRSTRVSLRSTNEKTHVNTGSVNVGSCNERLSSVPASESNVQTQGSVNNGAGLAVTSATKDSASRRWSMALSSMGQSQASAQSLQSIAGDAHSNSSMSFVLSQIFPTARRFDC